MNGLGLTLTPGETNKSPFNFLFIFFINICGRFGIDAIPASRIIGIASGCLTFILLFVIIKYQNTEAKGLGLLCMLPLAANGCFSAWSLSGLSEPLFTVIFLSTILFAAKPRRHSSDGYITGTLIGLSYLADNSILLLLIVVTIAILIYWNWTEYGNSFKNTFMIITGFAVIVFAYLIWSHLNYGTLFMDMISINWHISPHAVVIGFKNMGRVMAIFGFPAIFLVFNLISISQRPCNIFLTIIMVVQALLLLSHNANSDYPFRYLLPILPLFYFLVVQGLINLQFLISRRQNHLPVSMVIIVVIALTIINSAVSEKYLSVFKVRDASSFVGEKVGLFIREHWNVDALIAADNSGSLPYFSGCSFIPLCNAFDERTTTQKKPDYIILGPPQGDSISNLPGNERILESSEFKENYAYRFYRIVVNDPDIWHYASTSGGSILFQFYERKVPVLPDTATISEEQPILLN